MKYPREFEGLFARYWEEQSRFDPTLQSAWPDAVTATIRENVAAAPYVILAGDAFAGLLVTAVPGHPVEDGAYAACICDLYIAPEYRGRGIAKDIVLQFVGSQTGDTGVRVTAGSPGESFFQRLFDRADYRYNRKKEDGGKVLLHIRRKASFRLTAEQKR